MRCTVHFIFRRVCQNVWVSGALDDDRFRLSRLCHCANAFSHRISPIDLWPCIFNGLHVAYDML
jgi:hypothetical protein